MEMMDAGEGREMAAAGKNQGLNEVCIWDGLRESSSFPTVLRPCPGERSWPSPPHWAFFLCSGELDVM